MSDQRLPDNIPDLLQFISVVYDYRINECGPVANGVFWSSQDLQVLRYEVLLKAIFPEDLKGPISINDLGCGYGALFDLIAKDPMMKSGRYIGYDISEKMIRTAKTQHHDFRTRFITSPVATEVADYSFVSGTYNMYMGTDAVMWRQYIKTSLNALWSKTTKAMAFNLLSEKSTKNFPDLFYANAQEFTEYALTLSPKIELIDDYDDNEFTLIVKRQRTL
ncbi:MAG: class I SAM-dependent methyltransferase [Magnetovibrio sp.]|nr:class I SAM-dependent methyltransferase [Magnetovibrio sp.]